MAYKGLSSADEVRIALKYVILKVKRLCIDASGDYGYIDNFDHVIKDIFGFEKLGSKLESCYDDRDTITLIKKFSIKQLMSFCDNPRIYAAISELIAMDSRLEQIKKEFRKSNKKGKKKDKDLVKEDEYLRELYKDSIKVVTKRLGLKKKGKSYKNQYTILNDMVRQKSPLFNAYDDDDEMGVFFDDDIDDDDDYDNTSRKSEFSRYLGKFAQKSRPSRDNNKRGRVEEDDDDDVIFDDDDDEDTTRLSNVERSLNKLTSMFANYLMKDPQSQVSYRDLSGDMPVPINPAFTDDIEDEYEEEGDQVLSLNRHIPPPEQRRTAAEDTLGIQESIQMMTSAIGSMAAMQQKMLGSNERMADIIEAVIIDRNSNAGPETQVDVSKTVVASKVVAVEETLVSEPAYTPDELQAKTNKELIKIHNSQEDGGVVIPKATSAKKMKGLVAEEPPEPPPTEE